jgi:hypothetical protein
MEQGSAHSKLAQTDLSLEHTWFELTVDETQIILTAYTSLDDWLTVHRNITLIDLQLDAQNSYLFTYNTFTVAQLVEALRYKSEGRGFDYRWCH